MTTTAELLESLRLEAAATKQQIQELKEQLEDQAEQHANEIAAVNVKAEEAAIAGLLATHPAKKLQETVENAKMKKKVDLLARLAACCDLVGVKFDMVTHKPAGTDALLRELGFLIREAFANIQAHYLGASAAPGNRGFELAESYIIEMEPYFRAAKGEKFGDMNLLLSHPEARKNALQIVKDAEKEGKSASGSGGRGGSSFGGGGGRGLGYNKPNPAPARVQQGIPNNSAGGNQNTFNGGGQFNSNGKRPAFNQGRGG